jgi:hypothetical protein
MHNYRKQKWVNTDVLNTFVIHLKEKPT